MPTLYTRDKDKFFTFLGILLAMFLGALDQTIVSTALPKIVEDLRGLDRYTWVATSYLLASTVLVPIYGKLADTYSRKRIELGAVLTFLAGSFLCGLAGEFGPLPLLGDGMNQLIAFRALQGMGGAGLFAMAFIIIADLFPPAERGRYQGFVGAVFGIASVLGPWVGGMLTDYGSDLIPGVAGWRWVFYVNLPFGAIALWFIVMRMPRLQPPGEPRPLHWPSASLLVSSLVALMLALQADKSVYPWTSPLVLGLLAGAALGLLTFVRWSTRLPNPLLAFQLFANRVFRFSNLALFMLGAVFISILIFEPLFVVNVLGFSATQAGSSLIPLSMGIVAGSTTAGQLVSRFGHYRRWMLGGLSLLFVGMLLLSGLSAEITYWQLVLIMFTCGLGMGPSFPLYTLAIQNAVEMRFIGQATSASQFFRQMGGVIGSAMMGALLTGVLLAQLGFVPESVGASEGGGQAPAQDYLPALKNAFQTGVTRIYTGNLVLIALAIVATLFVPELPLRRSNRPPADSPTPAPNGQAPRPAPRPTPSSS